MADQNQPREKGKVKPAPFVSTAEDRDKLQTFLDQSFSRYQQDLNVFNEPGRESPGQNIYRPTGMEGGTVSQSRTGDLRVPASAFDEMIKAYGVDDVIHALKEWYGPQFKSVIGNYKPLPGFIQFPRSLVTTPVGGALPRGPLTNPVPTLLPTGGGLINKPSMQLPSGPLVGGRAQPLQRLKEGFTRDLLDLIASRSQGLAA